MNAPARRLLGLERALMNPSSWADPAMGKLLADDFIEFGRSGKVYTRSQVVAATAKAPALRLSVKGFKARLLAPSVCLVTYRTASREGRHALRSSIWVRRAGSWRLAFHQGTPTAG